MKKLKITLIFLPFLFSLLFEKISIENAVSPSSDIEFPISNYSMD